MWFERALAVRDDYAPLYVRLGQLQLETGEHDAAQTSFRRALELDSSTIFARLGLARLLLLRGELEASAEQLAAAEQTRPGFREAYGVLADVYRRMGRVEELVWLRRQLARMPDATPMADPLLRAEWAPHGASAFWHDQRGKQAARRGDYSTAIREHEKAIAIRPRAVFLNNHAVALEGAERVDEALATLEAALQLDPGLAVLYINRASLLRDAGRHDQAITTLREGLARAPTDITLTKPSATSGSWRGHSRPRPMPPLRQVATPSRWAGGCCCERPARAPRLSICWRWGRPRRAVFRKPFVWREMRSKWPGLSRTTSSLARSPAASRATAAADDT